MIKYSRALIAAAIVVTGTLTACSGASNEASTSSAQDSTAVAMPQTATYIADMPEQDGASMTAMAIVVAGDNVIAYATNGIDDESYFFGTQNDGVMDMASTYGDTLKASYDGTAIKGELAINEEGSAPQTFTASSVSAPAGMYTAEVGQARASWIVQPTSRVVGVMDNSAPGDHKVTDQIEAQNQEFKDRVRQMRLDREMRQAPKLTVGTFATDMNGTPTKAVRVTGDMTF